MPMNPGPSSTSIIDNPEYQQDQYRSDQRELDGRDAAIAAWFRRQATGRVAHGVGNASLRMVARTVKL